MRLLQRPTTTTHSPTHPQLNNSEVTSVITRVMRSDPAFVALMEHVGPLTAVSLPAPARLLLLEDLTPHPAPPGGEPAGHPCEHGGDVGRSLLHLLEGIQRGVVAAAARVGEVRASAGACVRAPRAMPCFPTPGARLHSVT